MQILYPSRVKTFSLKHTFLLSFFYTISLTILINIHFKLIAIVRWEFCISEEIVFILFWNVVLYRLIMAITYCPKWYWKSFQNNAREESFSEDCSLQYIISLSKMDSPDCLFTMVTIVFLLFFFNGLLIKYIRQKYFHNFFFFTFLFIAWYNIAF